MNCYLLTSGSHDTFAVRAVCTSEDQAHCLVEIARDKGEEWASLYRERIGDINIETWELNKLDCMYAPTLEGSTS